MQMKEAFHCLEVTTDNCIIFKIILLLSHGQKKKMTDAFTENCHTYSKKHLRFFFYLQ